MLHEGLFNKLPLSFPSPTYLLLPPLKAEHSGPDEVLQGSVTWEKTIGNMQKKSDKTEDQQC